MIYPALWKRCIGFFAVGYAQEVVAHSGHALDCVCASLGSLMVLHWIPVLKHPAAAQVTQCAWKWLCSIGLPIVIAVGGAVWWFFDSSWQLGYASIFFLMMPDLIQAFMRNQTHLQSAIKVHSNMTGHRIMALK